MNLVSSDELRENVKKCEDLTFSLNKKLRHASKKGKRSIRIYKRRDFVNSSTDDIKALLDDGYTFTECVNRPHSVVRVSRRQWGMFQHTICSDGDDTIMCDKCRNMMVWYEISW